LLQAYSSFLIQQENGATIHVPTCFLLTRLTSIVHNLFTADAGSLG